MFHFWVRTAKIRNKTTMHSPAILLPLNIVIIPAAYWYGAGGLTVQGVKQWVFNREWNSVVDGSASTLNASKAGSSGSSSSDTTTVGDYVCLDNPPNMRPMFLSYEPIMVYLENFVTEFERNYLVKLA